LTQLTEKRKEYNIPIFLGFVGYEKAFDRVNHNKLWSIMIKRGFLKHLIRAAQSLYHETQIIIEREGERMIKKISINQGVRQGCPLSPTPFSLYVDNIIRRRQIELKDKFYINNTEINTLLSANDQVILANSEDNLQRAIHRLYVISKDYNVRISIDITKVLALRGKDPIRIKIVINAQILDQVLNFNYLSYNMGLKREMDINVKLHSFQQICGTIKEDLSWKS
jgi:hypothetical protein